MIAVARGPQRKGGHVGRRRGRVARALSAGVVPDYRTASGLLDALLEGNRAELPRFFNG